MKALLPHPLGRLASIAEGVYRAVAEHDAAGGPRAGRLQILAGAAQKTLQVDVMIDARDEELAPFSFAQQRDAAIHALAAAGQHDDRVGGLRAVLGRRLDREPNETGDTQDEEPSTGDCYSVHRAP